MKTKEKILYATLDLASKEGLGRISMSDIASAIGIKKPSLYNHYASKEELITSMFVTIKQNTMELFNDADMDAYIERFPTEAILYHAIDLYCKWNQHPDVCKLNRVILSEKMTNPLVRDMDLMETEERVAYFINLFRKMKQHGKASIQNEEFAAKLIVYHMQKLIERILMGDDGVEKDIFNLTHNFAIIFSRGDL